VVNIEFDTTSKQLLLQCSGKQFHEEIEVCRYLKAIFNSNLKKWSISPSRLDEVLDEFKQFGVSISEYDKREIKNYFDNLKELEKNIKRSEYLKFVPNLMKLPPIKNFQELDISQGTNSNRRIFAHATGLGKSYIATGIMEHLRYYNKANKCVFLTSSIGIWNLKHELLKFGKNQHEEETLVIRSVAELKDRDIFNRDKFPEIKTIICGYDTFRLISDYYDKTVNNRTKKVKYRKSSIPLKDWLHNNEGIFIMDECHLLGNPNSLRTRSIFMNKNYFKYRYAFSATIADKNEKLFPLLKITDEDLVNGCDYYDWLSQYWVLGNKFSDYGINHETFKENKWILLQDRLYSDYAVKRGKELLNLPPAYEMEPLETEMSDKHREIYESFTYYTINQANSMNLKNNAGVLQNTMNIFAYLQLAIDNPLCLLNSAGFENFDPKLQKLIKNFNYEKDFYKLKILDDIIQDECYEKDHKVIIFYYHPKTLQCLQEHFKHEKTYTVSSEVPKDERLPIIEKFKKDTKSKILFASILIANSSFTLVECKASIFYELTYSYIITEQAKGRNYRIGQEDEVIYYYFKYLKSIDNLIHENLKRKGEISNLLVRKNLLNDNEWKLIFNGDSDQISSFFNSI
jgi:superfamily II DNA or RNA helicase